MNRTAVHPEQTVSTELLEQRLRAVGIATLQCDPTGEIDSPSRREGEWLVALVRKSPLFIDGLRAGAQRWSNVHAPVPVEIVPGLWAAAIPRTIRRRREGYVVAVIPTMDLVGSEHLAAMCQAGRMDFQLANHLLRALPPAAVEDVPRLAALVRFGHDDQAKLLSENKSMESLGQQLAESYEEINLLYTITQNMTVRERPEHFIRAALGELLQTLPYRWIAAQFADDPQRLKRVAGRLFIAGETDINEPRMQEMTRRLLEQSTPNAPRVLDAQLIERDAEFAELGEQVMTHPITVDDRVIGLLLAGNKLGADSAVSSVDLKLLGATASHTAIFLENAALYADLNGMFLGTLEALTASIDAKDRYTCGHSRRVALLTKQLGLAVGLSEKTVERMHIAGLVHDVGKIGVPEKVLTKPGRLTEDEFAWIRKHPEMGYRILKDIPQLDDVLPGVLYHHERWDGHGYPHGLAAEQIPLVARLIALADSFDAMSSTRTYRPAITRDRVLAEILNCGGTQFDPDLVRPFVDLDFSEYDRRVRDDQMAEKAGAYVPVSILQAASDEPEAQENAA